MNFEHSADCTTKLNQKESVSHHYMMGDAKSMMNLEKNEASFDSNYVQFDDQMNMSPDRRES